ncbi:hypothetical protein [Pseudoxanthobacter sp.]|uniref:hypothetical protein n=1 Tax=Pseudoxanthobacter sp. TaxID=1925742 RepID=UPI002FE353E1
MGAIGCLAPLFLLIAGALGGHLIGGAVWGLWGGGLGFAGGMGLMGAAFWFAARLRNR